MDIVCAMINCVHVVV